MPGRGNPQTCVIFLVTAATGSLQPAPFAERIAH